MIERSNYGLDAPRVVRRFLLLGVSLLAASLLLFLFRSRAPLGKWFIFPLLAMGVCFAGTALIMTWASYCGKVRFTERLLDSIPWRGDEQVLDVGCGHGLMLIGAAKRLTTGRAVGIDLWQKEDQAGNSPEATLANARLEGVADRVEVKDGDQRTMPFAA